MLPVERFKDIIKAPDAGYASVYAFNEADAKTAIDARSSGGLNKFAAWSDMLMIDLDDGERQLRKTALKLLKLGLMYTVWASGGKGFHIGIPLHMPVYSHSVPYSQRKWVEALDIGADLSLYQHGRLLSLPGRVHPKTGKKKAQLYEVMNDALKLALPIVEQPAPVFTAGVAESGTLAGALWQLMGLLENDPGPGNRHTKTWSTAKSLADAGLEYDTVLDLLQKVNEEWLESREVEKVTLAVKQAYKK